jgi:hypothetical protein
MAPALAGAIGSLGTIAGYLISGKNDEAKDRRAAARETAARQVERKIRREQWSHEFQRDLLLSLQEELQKMVRVTARNIIQDEKTLRERGKLFLLPSGWSDEAYAIGVSVRTLTVRVVDDRLRGKIADFRTACVRLELDGPTRAKDLDPSSLGTLLERNLAELTQKFESLSDSIGASLRRELGPGG